MARPANRVGCCRTHPATSSLDTRFRPLGPRQALSNPTSTPAASIDSTVTAIGMSCSGIAPPVQRRSEANISLAMNLWVGCCIHTSMVMTRL